MKNLIRKKVIAKTEIELLNQLCQYLPSKSKRHLIFVPLSQQTITVMGLNNVLTLCRKKLRVDPSSLDADDPIEDESDDSVDEEDEDDTAELMAELQRIKAERASELAKKVLTIH